MVVELDDAVEAGGLGEGEVVAFNGAAWNVTSETVPVIDWRTGGDEIAAGKRVVCVQFGEWFLIVNAECP